MTRAISTLAVILFVAAYACSQQPEIFDVSNVVAGAQRLETRYAYAVGKWSDASDRVGTNSTQIHCYERFGLCEVASAYSMGGQAWVNLDTYDILRWDSKELIAVDSSAICIVNTVRFDFSTKRVSLSSASKGEKQDKMCDAVVNNAKDTAFLMNLKDEQKRIHESPKQP